MKITFQWDSPEEPFEYLHGWIADPSQYEEHVARGACNHIADLYDKLPEKPHPLPTAIAAVERAAPGSSQGDARAALDGLHVLKVACLEGVQAMLDDYKHFQWFEPRPRKQRKSR